MIFEKQEYQQECINNIISLLENFDFTMHSKENLKDCLVSFYAKNYMPVKEYSNNLNLDILMETGTGKTFTYLNLIFELHKHFKQNKFIIFVPRKAILESIKQNIKLTQDYFYNQYKKYLVSYIYSDTKSQSDIINHYIKNTDELSILILTNSSIDKATNILNRYDENLYNIKSTFANIAELKPISIIDEPHLLKGKAFNKYFQAINTLYFRFGATFPADDGYKISNMIYCLDSISAFKQYLVKQIKINTITQNSQNLVLSKTDKKSATFTHYKNGIEINKEYFLNQDLGELDSSLRGISINRIQKDKVFLSNGILVEKKISYTLDESEISILLSRAIDLHFEKEEKLFKQNIKALSLFFIAGIDDFRGENPFVKNEFERIYQAKRLSVLSKDISPEYRRYLLRDIDENGRLKVHQGYFSGDCHFKGTKEDIEANDIKMILQDKEKLLSFDTSLRFIFSVWALQEGWDNPNIFTLTKLSNSSSEISRHQQVGRGLRLCVNDEGKRITHRFTDFNDDVFFGINCLDMIVSGEEKNFIENLQKEIINSSFSYDGVHLSINLLKEEAKLNEDEANELIGHLKRQRIIEFSESVGCYVIIAPIKDFIESDTTLQSIVGDKLNNVLALFKSENNKNQIINANEEARKIKIRKAHAQEFKELWDEINKKANLIYKDINKAKLVDQIAESFNKYPIDTDKLILEVKRYDVVKNLIVSEKIEKIGEKQYNHNEKSIRELMLNFAIDEKLPLAFVLEIYNKLNKQNIKNSPKRAFETLRDIIKNEIHKALILSISYDFNSKAVSNTIMEDLLYKDDGTPKEYIEMHKLGKYCRSDEPSKKYLYDEIVFDSIIEADVMTENNELNNGNEIMVFAKLPKLSIPTPYKNYEPDFAYLIKVNNKQKIFFICETKGYDSNFDIPEIEKIKINYAERFFECLNQSLKNKNIKVVYKTRINKQSLFDVLQSVNNLKEQ